MRHRRLLQLLYALGGCMIWIDSYFDPWRSLPRGLALAMAPLLDPHYDDDVHTFV